MKELISHIRHLFANFQISKFSNYLIYSLLIFGLSSCFKEKLLKPPTNDNAGQSNLIPMRGPNYDDQFFYSLATNTIVSSNSRFIYDLMFDCNPATFHIWLNSAKFSCVADVGTSVPFGQVTLQDTVGYNFNYERGAYSTDSSAFGEWRDSASVANNSNNPNSKGHVYIINLGVDTLGNPFGYIKMMVVSFSDGGYNIVYSDMANLNNVVMSVPKDPTRNYRYLSVATNQLLPIEPDARTWDLCFTHYTYVFYIPYLLPYEVTGVLTNPSRVQAYLYTDTFMNFDSVKISNFNPGLLQTQRDVIGYDWKRYTGTYTVNSQYTYFISASNNVYYKLHFVGYYLNGVEGYISLQYVQL